MTQNQRRKRALKAILDFDKKCTRAGDSAGKPKKKS